MRRLLMSAAAMALLAGCQAKSSGPEAAPSGAASSAAASSAALDAPRSIQEVMQGHVIPQSDLIWNAVGITFEGGKEVRLAPKNDAEWQDLAKAAADIRSGAVALQTPGLPVVAAGGKIQGEGTAGALGAAQVQALVDKDRPMLATRAKALEAAAKDLEAAIAARNVDKIMDLGGTMDEACESCHKIFWYPNQPTIP